MPDKPLCTLLVLLHGKYPGLHRRCLNSVLPTIPKDIPIRIGLNEVCEPMLAWLERGSIAPQMLVPGALGAGQLGNGITQGRVTYYSSGNQNIKKYPMMRRMLWEDSIETDWVVWVDDDTCIDEGSKWWQLFESMAEDEETAYMGERWYMDWQGGQTKFIASRPWYRGKESQMHKGRQGIAFHTGGFLLVRTNLLKKLDWPDHKLVHNGGDTMLSEAVRQNDGHITDFPTRDCGIHVNDAKRRGYSEVPVGM